MSEVLQPPTFGDVLRAKQTLARYLPRTPLFQYAALDRLVGTRVLVKHENHQPVGAFKVRGGINLVSRLTDAERGRGVACASTGNHGQSIAYAARIFSTRATVVVPENANPSKVGAMRDLGAEVLHHGVDFDEAREHCEELARRRGMRYIHSGDEPLLIAGVATITLEIIEDAPDVNTIIVPVGGGSSTAGACLVAKTLDPRIRVIGVQAAGAPAAHDSWRARKLLAAPMNTAAEGLATRTAFALPQRMLWDWLDDFILVDEDEILRATGIFVDKARTLAEGAAAASLAAAIKLGEQLAGQTVALVLSGGNITVDQLRAALAVL
jgi:threonine dehydratase